MPALAVEPQKQNMPLNDQAHENSLDDLQKKVILPKEKDSRTGKDLADLNFAIDHSGEIRADEQRRVAKEIEISLAAQKIYKEEQRRAAEMQQKAHQEQAKQAEIDPKKIEAQSVIVFNLAGQKPSEENARTLRTMLNQMTPAQINALRIKYNETAGKGNDFDSVAVKIANVPTVVGENIIAVADMKAALIGTEEAKRAALLGRGLSESLLDEQSRMVFIAQACDGQTPEQIGAIKTEFKKLYGADFEEMQKRYPLSEKAAAFSASMLSTDPAARVAKELHDTINGIDFVDNRGQRRLWDTLLKTDSATLARAVEWHKKLYTEDGKPQSLSQYGHEKWGMNFSAEEKRILDLFIDGKHLEGETEIAWWAVDKSQPETMRQLLDQDLNEVKKIAMTYRHGDLSAAAMSVLSSDPRQDLKEKQTLQGLQTVAHKEDK